MSKCTECEQYYQKITILESQVETLDKENAVRRALSRNFQTKLQKVEADMDALMEYIEGCDAADRAHEAS